MGPVSIIPVALILTKSTIGTILEPPEVSSGTALRLDHTHGIESSILQDSKSIGS